MCKGIFFVSTQKLLLMMKFVIGNMVRLFRGFTLPIALTVLLR